MFNILIIGFILFPFNSCSVQAEETSEFDVNAEAGFAYDQKTGKILYAKNEDKKLGIASITKIISAYLILEQIKQKKLKWDDKIPICNGYAYDLTLNPNLSNIPLEKDHGYSVRELLNAALISSASSAIIALTEKIAGSEEKFIECTNKKLKSWGIKDVTLINSTGLNNADIPEKYRVKGSAPDQENMMSARDIGIVAYHLIHDFPEVLEITKKPTERFGVGSHSEVQLETWNGMLPGKNWEYSGVDGLKTGTTELAGKCFVGTCVKAGWRIVTVVLHANGEGDSRFAETESLMSFVYDNWKQKKIVSKGDKFATAKTVPVVDGKQSSVSIAIGEDIKAWVRSDMDTEKLSAHYHAGKIKDLKAPVTKDEKVGKIDIHLKDDNLGYLLPSQTKKAQYQMVTVKPVKRNFFLKIWVDHTLNWINKKLG
jgi:D-alanyl-D-alanine carboxypeptidase (penicillin-binding protein 5/6)